MFALITGGAKGLGRHIALGVLKRGGNVVVADIDQKAGVELENEAVNEHGKNRLKFIDCNITNAGELKRAFDFCKAEFGKLTVVCNNAAIMTSDLSLTQRQIDINLTALVEGTFKAIDAMSVKSGGDGGVVVNIASGSGYNILRGSPVYTASKFGVVGFTRTFKFLQYVTEDAVRVNCLCPVFLDTEMTHKAVKENPEIEYQISDVGFSDMDDVVNTFLTCVDNEDLNGETIATHGSGGMYLLKFRQPIPVPIKKKPVKEPT